MCRKYLVCVFSCNCEFISQNYESTIRFASQLLQIWVYSFFCLNLFFSQNFEKLRIQTLHLAILNFYQPLLKFTSRNYYFVFRHSRYIYIIEFRPYEIYFYISQLPFSPKMFFFSPVLIVLESVFNYYYIFFFKQKQVCAIHSQRDMQNLYLNSIFAS